MKIISMTSNSKKAKLNVFVPFIANIILAKDCNAITIIVGIIIHRLSKGSLSANINKMPQDKNIGSYRGSREAWPVGSTIVIVHPGPVLLLARTVPPIAVTNFFTRARPIPVPPVERVNTLSTR